MVSMQIFTEEDSISQGSTDCASMTASSRDSSISEMSPVLSTHENDPKSIYLAFDIDGALGSDFIYSTLCADNKTFAKALMTHLLKVCNVRPQDHVTIITGGDRRDDAHEAFNKDEFTRPGTWEVLEAAMPVINASLVSIGHDEPARLDKRFFAEQLYPDLKKEKMSLTYMQMVAALDDNENSEIKTRSLAMFDQSTPLYYTGVRAECKMGLDQGHESWGISNELRDKVDIVLGNAWRLYYDCRTKKKSSINVKFVLIDDMFDYYPNLKKKKVDTSVDTLHRMVNFFRESDWLPHGMAFQFIKLSPYDVDNMLQKELSLPRKYLEIMVKNMWRDESARLWMQMFEKIEENKTILDADTLNDIKNRAKVMTVLYEGFCKPSWKELFQGGLYGIGKTMMKALAVGYDYMWTLVLDECTYEQQLRILYVILESRYWYWAGEGFRHDAYVDFQTQAYVEYLSDPKLNVEKYNEYAKMMVESVDEFQGGEKYTHVQGLESKTSSNERLTHPAPNPAQYLEEFWLKCMFPAAVAYRKHLEKALAKHGADTFKSGLHRPSKKRRIDDGAVLPSEQGIFGNKSALKPFQPEFPPIKFSLGKA